MQELKFFIFDEDSFIVLVMTNGQCAGMLVSMMVMKALSSYFNLKSIMITDNVDIPAKQWKEHSRWVEPGYTFYIGKHDDSEHEDEEVNDYGRGGPNDIYDNHMMKGKEKLEDKDKDKDKYKEEEKGEEEEEEEEEEKGEGEEEEEDEHDHNDESRLEPAVNGLGDSKLYDEEDQVKKMMLVPLQEEQVDKMTPALESDVQLYDYYMPMLPHVTGSDSNAQQAGVGTTPSGDCKRKKGVVSKPKLKKTAANSMGTSTGKHLAKRTSPQLKKAA